MCDVNKNKYVFDWTIKDFERSVITNGCLMHEIRSPMFTTKFEDQTAWFLKLNFMQWNFKEVSVSCFLERSKQDFGAEIIQIDWGIDVFNAKGNFVSVVEECKVIRAFKKGTSAVWGKYGVGTLQLPSEPESFIFRCHMLDYISKKKPVSCGSFAQSKFGFFSSPINAKTRFWFLQLFGPEKTLLEMQMQTNVVPISLWACRIKDGSSFSCDVVCKIKMYDFEHREFSSKEIVDTFKSGPESHTFHTDDKTYYLNWNSSWGVPCFVGTEYCISIPTQSPTIYNSELDRSVKLSPAFNLDTVAIFQKDVLRMYVDKIQSDVNLRIGLRMFPAHKCVLSARSPVFSTMFEQDMLENQTGVVDITDLDVKTLSLLLKYIYSGVIDELDYEKASKLMLAAEKYQVLSLKEICSSCLKGLLSEENVCEVLIIADMVNHEDLKSTAMNYVQVHAQKILLSDNWKRLVERNVSLVAETLSKLSVAFGTAASKGSS